MFFVFDGLQLWMQTLEALKDALNQRNADVALTSYRRLFLELSKARVSDLPTAIASLLLEKDSSLSHYVIQDEVPQGLLQAARHDLEVVFTLLKHDWQAETQRLTGKSLPPLNQLANADKRSENIAEKLKSADASVLDDLIRHYKQHGTGVLGKYTAFRWVNHQLWGIDFPVDIDMRRLIGLERQLGMLQTNTSAFLNRKPAQHTLLYGPRGSGKSTAVRSLLKSYAPQGLRLIELAAQEVLTLPEVIDMIRLRPHRYILFVDDLSFEQGDNSYHPLKTLLEGSLTARADNVLIYATSNRRHLVKENFSDRPDPLSDDVHRWDTHHERLALSDRFGLTITFPDASQQRYLAIVKGLLDFENLVLENVDERAIRFAEWGNGYSGRTAQQFVDSLDRD
jgi:hypothetical protein